MIEYRVTAECDECGKKEVAIEEGIPGYGVVHVGNHLIPPTWSYVGGRLICDEHQLIIKAEENS